MARLSDLIVRITADTAQFARGTREVSAQLSRLGAVADSAVRGISASFERISSLGSRLSLGVTAPLAALGVAAVRADADIEALRMGLISVSGSAAAADRQISRLAEVAKLPGLGFREALQGAVNLQAAGFSAQLAELALKAFGNALATVGRGKAELDGVIVALSQIQAKGKVSAEEINQLAERIPQIRAAMKAAFGTADTEALQKMGISAQEFVERIIAQFEKLPPVTGGVKNQFENLRDAIDRALADLGAALRPGTELLLRAAESWTQTLGGLAQQLRTLPVPAQAAIAGIVGLVAAIGPLMVAIGQVGMGLAGLQAALPVIRALTAVSIAGVAQVAASLAQQLVPALASATVAAQAFWGALALTGAAAAAAAAVVSVSRLVSAGQQLKDAQRAAADAAQAQARGIELLRIRLHQAGVSTEELDRAARQGEISVDRYVQGLLRLAAGAARASQAQESAVRSTADLGNAFRVLGIESTQALTERYERARQALAEIERAYRDGKASAMDLARAQDAVRRAYEAIYQPIKAVREELGKMQAPESLGAALRDMLSDMARERALRESEQQLRALADILSLRGFEPDRFPWAMSGVAESARQASVAAQITDRYYRAMWASIADQEAAQRAERQLRQLAQSLGINIEALRELDAAKKRIGIAETRDVAQMERDVQTIWRSNVPLLQKQRAEYELLVEKRRQGIDLSAVEQERLASLERTLRSSASAQATLLDRLRVQISTVLTDTGARIADLIFKGGKLGDVMVGALEAIGKALARLAIEKALAGIASQIGAIVSKIPGLGKLASIFGSGAQAASAGAQAATAVSAGAQVASQTAGAVGKVIGSSFSALAGVVTGAISAVTGVIGVFQNARQEGSLNAIEWNTRKSSLHLEHIIHRINAGLPGFGDVQARIVEVRDVLIGWDQYITGGLKLSGAGGGNITINMEGANFIGFRDLDAFLDELVRRLKQRGV